MIKPKRRSKNTKLRYVRRRKSGTLYTNDKQTMQYVNRFNVFHHPQIIVDTEHWTEVRWAELSVLPYYTYPFVYILLQLYDTQNAGMDRMTRGLRRTPEFAHFNQKISSKWTLNILHNFTLFRSVRICVLFWISTEAPRLKSICMCYARTLDILLVTLLSYLR